MFKQPFGRSILLLALGLVPAAAQGTVTSTSTAGALTLEQCYQKALVVSETLAISDQEIEQIAAIYRQGVGQALPRLTWNMSQFWQDTSQVEQSSGGVQGTLLRSRRPESFFQVEQPLFHGLREYHAVKGLKAAKRSSELNRQQAALNLLVDVADVFYASLDLQQEMDALQSQLVLTEDRLKELQRRVRLGRSRDSEVLSAQVEFSSLQAEIHATRQRWMFARQTLAFLTEVPPLVPLIEPSPLPRVPVLEDAHAKSASRPDLLAAAYIQEQERYQVRYAKGGFLPALDFTGKYYTERVGFNEDVKWDALLDLEVPIFNGLITRAEVQEAKSKVIVADLALSRTKRLIYRDVEIAHANLQTAAAQAEYYGTAVKLAEQNYRVQQDEYKLGLINNLQVLQVLSDLQDLKISKLRSDAAVRLNDIRLRVATGQGI